LRELFQEQKTFVKQLIDVEATEKELTIKLKHKERSFKRLEIIKTLSGQSLEPACQKLETLRNQTLFKQSQLAEQSNRLKASLNTNNEQIQSLQHVIDEWANQRTDGIRNRVNFMYESLTTDVNSMSFSTKYKHAKRHLTLQDNDQKNNEKLISQLLEIITAQQNKINGNQSGTPARRQLTNQIEELPNSLLFDGPKIKWADQTLVTDTENQDPQNMVDSNVNFYLDFKSCTPLKTPSRKPSVLRRIVQQTRGHDNDTTLNTTLNTGPVRGFKQPSITINEPNKHSDNVNETFSISSLPLNSTYIRDTEIVNDDEERRKTFILSTPHAKTERPHSLVEYPDTPSPEENGEYAKSYIPVRPPLKEKDKNTVKNGMTSFFKSPRMRSFTEGNGTKLKKQDRTFTVPKFNKKRHANLGMPVRSTSTLNLHKENVKPKNKSKTLRPSQSLISLNSASKTNTKSSKQNKGRFRF